MNYWEKQKQRQMATGIYDAQWLWSGSACITTNPPSSDEAIMAEQHKEANGQKFDIREGLLIDGKRHFPGLAQNCKCVSKIILPF